MSRRTIELSWTLRVLAAHLARGEDAADPDVFFDVETGAVNAGDCYWVRVLERGRVDAHHASPSTSTLVAMARRGVLVHLDVPGIDADRVAEMLIVEDDRAGRADLARIIAAAMWGAHPSIERAIERAGVARWHAVEEHLALRALTTWARERDAAVTVSSNGTIRFTLAAETFAVTSMNNEGATEGCRGGQPLRHP